MLRMLKSNDVHEFKPALAEIEEAPVNPLGRSVFWTILALVLFAIGWLTLGEVDIVVSARGKVVPEGQVKVIQPLEVGVIRKFYVQPGSMVKKGQVLVELEPQTTAPALVSNEQNLAYAQLEMARLKALVAGRSFSATAGGADAEAVETQATLYQAGRESLDGQLTAKHQELKQVGEQLAATKVAQEQAEKQLGLLNAQLTRLKPVEDIVPRQELDSLEKDQVRYSHERDEARYRLAELTHKKSQIISEMAGLKEGFHRQLLDELAQKDKTRIDLTAKIEESRFRNQKQQLLAPEDGVIDQIFIHTVGGVVTPAQKLLTLVPKSAPLVIEASVLSKDIGFVHTKQQVTLKIDTFDYQKYGTVSGTVVKVSSDSHVEDPKVGPVYTVTVQPEKLVLNVNGHPEPLRPGMTVSSEIAIGKRKMIEFFIYPMIKSFDDAVSLR
jgi:hemolysin D